MMINMFEGLIGEHVKLIIKDGEDVAVEYGVILECAEGFLKLDTGVVIRQDAVMRAKPVRRRQ